MDQFVSRFVYRLRSTGHSSARYGNCEVCGQHCPEVFVQREMRTFRHEQNGQIVEGETYHGCVAHRFGHRECLKSKQRDFYVEDSAENKCVPNNGQALPHPTGPAI